MPRIERLEPQRKGLTWTNVCSHPLGTSTNSPSPLQIQSRRDPLIIVVDLIGPVVMALLNVLNAIKLVTDFLSVEAKSLVVVVTVVCVRK